MCLFAGMKGMRMRESVREKERVPRLFDLYHFIISRSSSLSSCLIYSLYTLHLHIPYHPPFIIWETFHSSRWSNFGRNSIPLLFLFKFIYIDLLIMFRMPYTGIGSSDALSTPLYSTTNSSSAAPIRIQRKSASIPPPGPVGIQCYVIF